MDKKPIWASRLDSIANDDPDYPNMDFEDWFQHGLNCHRWNLPRPLVRRAFRALCSRFRPWGRDKPRKIAMWQVRAFIYGCRGGYDESRSCLVPDYVWPLPVDPSWQLVAFVYHDGEVVLDWLHPVSRRFWTEDNGSLVMPPQSHGFLNEDWFRCMGFDVLVEFPQTTMVAIGPVDPRGHLNPTPPDKRENWSLPLR